MTHNVNFWENARLVSKLVTNLTMASVLCQHLHCNQVKICQTQQIPFEYYWCLAMNFNHEDKSNYKQKTNSILGAYVQTRRGLPTVLH